MKLLLLLSVLAFSAWSQDFSIGMAGAHNIYPGSTLYLQVTSSGIPSTRMYYTVSLPGSATFIAACGATPDQNVGCYPDGALRYAYNDTQSLFLSISGLAVPGDVSVTLNEGGVIHVKTWAVALLAAPPAVNNHSMVQTAVASIWASVMTASADGFCFTNLDGGGGTNIQPGQPVYPAALSFGIEQQIWYYDGSRVMYQIADYTANPSKWNPCALWIASQYRDYVVGAGGGVPGYVNFARGMRMAYERTGDASYKNAVLLLRDNAAYHTGGVTEALIRETSYAVDTMIEAERTGEARSPNLARAVDYLLGDIDVLVGGTMDFVQNQSFYDGLAAEALINWWEISGHTDMRIPAAIKRFIDWWELPAFPSYLGVSGKAWSGTSVIWDPMPFGQYCDAGCGQMNSQFNGFLSNVYYWYSTIAGDAHYRDVADAMLLHMSDDATVAAARTPTEVSRTYPYSGKEFSQRYRWMGFLGYLNDGRGPRVVGGAAIAGGSIVQ